MNTKKKPNHQVKDQEKANSNRKPKRRQQSHEQEHIETRMFD
jgi:hypothetical protein